MKNKVSENMANNPEEIENALNFLVDSKIIIISITIIFTFISLFYVLNTKPTYQSFVKMRIGQIDDNNLAMLALKNEVQGSFPKVEIKINDKHRLGPFFSLKSNSTSPELSREQLQDAIDFSIDRSKNFINKRMDTNDRMIDDLSKLIQLREAQLENIVNSNYPGNFSKYMHISNLNFLLDEMKIDYESKFLRFNDPTFFEYTKIVDDVSTTQLKEKPFLTIAFGIITGLITAIPVSYILLVWRRFKR